MKKLLVLLGIMLSFGLNSCLYGVNCTHGNGKIVVKEVNLSKVSGVDFELSGDVYIYKGSEQKITYETDENIFPLIENKVEKGILEIDSKESICPTKFIVNITVSDLTHVEIDGSGDIIIKDEFNTPMITLKIDGSGDITAKSIITDKCDMSIDGSGDIDVKGKSKLTTAEIDGSGDINTVGLESSIVYAEINGSGNIYLNVKNELNAKINGSGSIGYVGNPEVLKQKINGSGNIYRMK